MAVGSLLFREEGHLWLRGRVVSASGPTSAGHPRSLPPPPCPPCRTNGLFCSLFLGFLSANAPSLCLPATCSRARLPAEWPLLSLSAPFRVRFSPQTLLQRMCPPPPHLQPPRSRAPRLLTPLPRSPGLQPQPQPRPQPHVSLLQPGPPCSAPSPPWPPQSPLCMRGHPLPATPDLELLSSPPASGPRPRTPWPPTQHPQVQQRGPLQTPVPRRAPLQHPQTSPPALLPPRPSQGLRAPRSLL